MLLNAWIPLSLLNGQGHLKVIVIWCEGHILSDKRMSTYFKSFCDLWVMRFRLKDGHAQKWWCEMRRMWIVKLNSNSYPEMPTTKSKVLTQNRLILYWAVLTHQFRWQFYHWMCNRCNFGNKIISIKFALHTWCCPLIQKQGRVFNYLPFLDMNWRVRMHCEISECPKC